MNRAFSSILGKPRVKFYFTDVAYVVIGTHMELNGALAVLYRTLAHRCCRCLRPSFRHQVVHAITQHPFKLRSTNLDHMCNRPLWRPHSFGGFWPWPSRSNLTSKSKFTPFWACPCDNSSPDQTRTTKFGPEVENTLVKIFVVWGGQLTLPFKVNLYVKFSGITTTGNT